MAKRLTFSSLVKFGSKKRSTERRKSKIFFLLDSLCTRQLYLGCDWSTEEKWRKARETGYPGRHPGHFRRSGRPFWCNDWAYNQSSGIMHRLYILCSSHHYIWNPWAFVPGFCPGFRPLFSVFLRGRLIKTIMESRKENKSSFNRWVS